MSKRYSKLVGDHGAAIPSVLQVTEYFLSRAPEVVKLYNSMKISHEYIPQNKRRRVKSFKPYSHRPVVRKSRQFFPRPMSRRTMRRRRLQLRFGDEKVRLAVTHIWHAKRFHMEEVWNMRLPVRVNDKGERAIERAAKNGCVIHDRSYMDCWRLDKTVDAADALKEAGFGIGFTHPKVESGEYCCYGTIVVDGLVVSPFQIFNRDLEEIEVWTHPAARSECEVIMDKIGGKLVLDAVRFELLGSRALERMKKVFGTELHEKDCVPGKVISGPGVRFVTRGCGKLIDLFVENPVQAFKIWMDFAKDGMRAIGVNDRHQWLVKEYCVPDFPFDVPCSRAGARHAASFAKIVLDNDKAKPKQCKMNVSSVESPYFPDWNVCGMSGRTPDMSEICNVVVKTLNKGQIQMNAHLYLEEKLIGFVTSCCATANGVGIGAVSKHAQVETGMKVVKFRNPGCIHTYDAEIRVCSWKHSDIALLGLSAIKY